jgi:hypothetical protein
MGLFSGNTKSLPLDSREQFGVPASSIDTNEQARPVPVIYGRRRVGVTFLGQRFNVDYETEEEKKAGERRTYYCSYAALVCMGGRAPVDSLDEIYLDRRKVWPAEGEAGITRDTVTDKVVAIRVTNQGANYSAAATINIAGGSAQARPILKDGKIVEVIVTAQGSGFNPNSPPSVSAIDLAGSGASFQAIIGSETYTDVTIPDYGSWRFYWGCEEADYDPLLLTLSADTGRNPDGVLDGNPIEEHPAYVGQSYIVAIRQLLGMSRTLVPNVEVVVSRYPLLSWQEQASSNVLSDCNAITVIEDAMQEPRYGLGVADARLDTEGLNLTAVALGSVGISPLIDQVEDFRKFLTKRLEYFDGFATSTNDGKFTIGLIREYDCIENDPSTPYYDETCLTEPPSLRPASWDETHNMIWVKFTNRQLHYGPDARPANNAASLQITGEPSPLVLERPDFTRADLADIYARAAAQIEGLPKHSGILRVRKSKLQGLQVGGVFRLSWNHYELCWLQCRCIEISWTDPYKPEVEVEFELDRGYLSQQTYAAPIYTQPTPPVVDPVDAEIATVIELPYLFETGERPMLAALASRASKKTERAKVWHYRDGSSQNLLEIRSFAYGGVLSAALTPSSSGPVLVSLTGADNVLPDSISSLDTSQDEWLMLIGDEIFSLGTATLTDAETHSYSVTVARERFDTKRLDHALNAEVFIISRKAMKGCTFRTWKQYEGGETADFKIQTVTLGNPTPIDDIAFDTVTFSNRAMRHWKPRNLAVNGTNWWSGPTYSTGQNIQITWDPNNRAAPRGWEGDLPDIWYLEIRSMADAVLRTYTFAPADNNHTITNAALVSILGSETSFKVRIYAKSGTSVVLDSRYYDEATVTKV